jgi:hypothetical protein
MKQRRTKDKEHLIVSETFPKLMKKNSPLGSQDGDNKEKDDHKRSFVLKHLTGEEEYLKWQGKCSWNQERLTEDESPE